MLRWGLVPFWAKDPAIGNRMIAERSVCTFEKIPDVGTRLVRCKTIGHLNTEGTPQILSSTGPWHMVSDQEQRATGGNPLFYRRYLAIRKCRVYW